MKILVDSNVVIDFLSDREEFSDEAEKIFLFGACDRACEFVSASAVTDIHYIANKSIHNDMKTTEILKEFHKIVGIISVTDKDIEAALDLDWKDFENSVQYAAAKNNGVDLILTRDAKGFEQSNIPVISPHGFIEKYEDAFKELPETDEVSEDIKRIRDDKEY